VCFGWPPAARKAAPLHARTPGRSTHTTRTLTGLCLPQPPRTSLCSSRYACGLGVLLTLRLSSSCPGPGHGR
jgi:hypothetical protein